MKKRLRFCPVFALGLLITTTVTSQNNGWLRRFSTTDTLHSIQVLADGYVLFAQHANGIYRLRLDVAGNLLDSVSLGPTPADLIPAPDGGFFKVFSVDASTFRLEKSAANNAPVWQQTFTDTFSYYYPAIAALSDGGGYLTSMADPSLSYQSQLTQVCRFDALGNTLWRRYIEPMPSSTSTRRLNDLIVLPGSDCAVFSEDNWDGAHMVGLISHLSAVGDIMEHTYIGGPANYFHTVLPSVRLAANGDIWASGVQTNTSGGGHSTTVRLGFITRLQETGAGYYQAQQTLYPQSIFQMGMEFYKPEPIIAAALPSGDLLTVLREHNDVRLWCGSWNLEDTIGEQALTPAGGFFLDKIKRPNRLIYATADNGAIIGGVDSLGIFLRKIGPAEFAAISKVTSVRPTSCTLYPNPASDQVTVTIPAGALVRFQLISAVSGQVARIYPLLSAGSTYLLPLDGLTTGLYWVYGYGQDGQRFFGKLNVLNQD